MKYDYLIIGGGIAGVSAAEAIREIDREGTIAVVGREPHILYSRVFLPTFLKGRIPRDKLFLRSEDDFTQKRIALILGKEVHYLDLKRREAGLEGGAVLGYGKLLIASGGRVVPWGSPEFEDSIYRLQTIEDADRLFGRLDAIRNPIVVGASFIGLEFLDIFGLRKLPVTLVIREPHYMAHLLDPAGGELLREHFERHGIKMIENDEVSEFTQKNGSLEAHTKGLRTLSGDSIAVGVGIERNIEFLRGFGIELGENGIKVNEYLETSVPGVYAAGDAAEFYDLIAERHRTIGNWTNAFLQGTHAGRVMAGLRRPFRNVSAYSISNLGFQITAVGAYGDEYQSIARLEQSRNEYERLFLKDGVLAGAVLINRFRDKAHLAKLIESKTSLEEYKTKLRDIAFDIHQIPAVK